MRLLLLAALVFSLAACDAGVSSPPAESAEASTAPLVMASSKSESTLHVVTETVGVEAADESVVLHIDGRSFELRPGEAYMIGQVLSRIGDDVAATVGRPLPLPGGGDRCEPPQGGEGVTLIGGFVYDKCPPRPLPPRVAARDLDALLGRAAKVLEAPDGLPWERIPGGFRAPF